ncbi:MAG: M48 family metalloprotease [bacterium]
MSVPKTFWQIEKEKNLNISVIFLFLVLLYFVSFFCLWTIIKLFFHLRMTLENPHLQFRLFGADSIIILIIAFILGFGHWFYTNSRAVDKILKLLNARTPDKNDRYHYVFTNVIEEMCVASGNIQVETYIIPTIAMNAFALQDIYDRKVIGVTEGLISRLNRDELQAVLAHEMAHIVANDCLLTTIASSLFGVYNEMLNGLINTLNQMTEKDTDDYFQKRQQNVITAGILSIPIFVTLLSLSFLSQLLYVFISREKEYRADANAIKYTRNPLSLASALYKIATHYRGTALHLAPIFILSPQANPLEEREDTFANLFSTHPPFTRRLQLILEQAHADIGQIIAKQYKQQIAEKTGDIKPKFLVKKENTWTGPYTLLQLQTIDWLTPDTEIKFQETDATITANSMPALNHYFRVRESAIYKIRRICPLCNEWLIPQEYEGLYIWRCAFCDGLLVEKEKLSRIFARQEKGFSEHIQHVASLLYAETRQKRPHFKLTVVAPDKRKCPKCGKPMTRKFYSYAYHIEIDECAECNLIWFDRDELEILQCLIEKDGDYA